MASLSRRFKCFVTMSRERASVRNCWEGIDSPAPAASCQDQELLPHPGSLSRLLILSTDKKTPADGSFTLETGNCADFSCWVVKQRQSFWVRLLTSALGSSTLLGSSLHPILQLFQGFRSRCHPWRASPAPCATTRGVCRRLCPFLASLRLPELFPSFLLIPEEAWG